MMLLHVEQPRRSRADVQNALDPKRPNEIGNMRQRVVMLVAGAMCIRQNPWRCRRNTAA